MKLFVGLGNPGKEYENTRHNIGFVAIDKAVSGLRLPAAKPAPKFKSQIAAGEINNEKIIFAKPQTFMNKSGLAVKVIADFYKILPKDIVVVHDDKDIPLGEYKIQTNRGAAGHRGVESIIEQLGTKNFTRLRLGIKPDKIISDTADFVLSKFSISEKAELNAAINKALEEIYNR